MEVLVRDYLFSIGLALAKKKKKEKGKIFSLLGDGECYEGSVWESAISTELNLDNLTAVVDCNGFQNDGKIGPKMNYKDIYNKWKGFGWNTILCDGHNISKILKSLQSNKKNIPNVIIAKTIKEKVFRLWKIIMIGTMGGLHKNYIYKLLKN